MSLASMEKKIQMFQKKKKKSFLNYEMQVENLELPIFLVPNAYFLPSNNDNIIQK